VDASGNCDQPMSFARLAGIFRERGSKAYLDQFANSATIRTLSLECATKLAKYRYKSVKIMKSSFPKQSNSFSALSIRLSEQAYSTQGRDHPNLDNRAETILTQASTITLDKGRNWLICTHLLHQNEYGTRLACCSVYQIYLHCRDPV
jgi:hypothetical protein